MASGPVPTDRIPLRLLWIGSGFLLVVVLGIGLMRFSALRLPWSASTSDLPPISNVPDFVLVERSGRQVHRADLHGKVWVVNFMFTRCPGDGECLLETNRMARLQTRFARQEDVRLVSISVDPEYDTPAVLARYARRFGADAERWLFLTGAPAAIYRLARDGFHLGVIMPEVAPSTSNRIPSPIWYAVRAPLDMLTPAAAWAHHPTTAPSSSEPAILHSTRFVLVDRQARIRGYYDSRKEKAMRRLQNDVMLLLHEPAA